ncbi:hypothetical protein [[Mycobacterium] wendilense]|uniref:Uncharacterized protein n=1 Tax=[Mycobacterium] wendilense TaxID=3064284 RepID=A0ABN9P0C0_9MYCO|nr:hypothetical protein [Mycolicibacterium sp. MU0050]CAJ1580995.1 hypothetical protein MU0050_001313 [Mycolicibacterium sp. MU0050]
MSSPLLADKVAVVTGAVALLASDLSSCLPGAGLEVGGGSYL